MLKTYSAAPIVNFTGTFHDQDPIFLIHLKPVKIGGRGMVAGFKGLAIRKIQAKAMPDGTWAYDPNTVVVEASPFMSAERAYVMTLDKARKAPNANSPQIRA